MLKTVRNLSKSKTGVVVLALFLVAIVASFALADISNVLSGNPTARAGELARVGSVAITERDLDNAMQRRLQQVRQQNPAATYADIAGEIDTLLQALIDERALQAFADRNGFTLSKRLIDGQIASIPQTRGLDGRFSEESYQRFLAQQRLSDAELRQLIAGSLLQRLLLVPAAVNARVPIGMARPYASMLLENRSGEILSLPIESFRAGLNPAPAQLQAFYRSNQNRYLVPEQRVLQIARLGPDQVVQVTASEAEIAASYRQNQARYAPSETRTLSQAVVPDQAAAQAIAQRARSGQALAAAAAPAGLAAADVAVGEQTRQQFEGLAGAQVAAAAFAAAEGGVVGPIRSELGWHVVKIENVRRTGGTSLAEARSEIAAEITANKRKEALTDLVNRVEDAIADGASFAEAARTANLQVVQTPLITAQGRSPEQPAYALPEPLRPALSAGFELADGDDPVVETLPGEAGYLLVGAERIVPAAPAPFQAVADRVRQDWIATQAAQRARQAAERIARTAGSAPLAQAARAAGIANPTVDTVSLRRIQLSQFGGQVPPPLALLFSQRQGATRPVSGSRGEGWYVVRVNRIVPGDASAQPSLIAQTQQQLQATVEQEYAMQFLQAAKQAVGVRRNEAAIAAAKRRLSSN
jgi:peptidyl-prolyl cis-trans isomerase D